MAHGPWPMLLQDLQTSSEAEALPMGAAGRFQVRAKHVAVRAQPELRGKARDDMGVSHPGDLKCVINVFNMCKFNN